MSHFTVLVVGDNAEDQLAPFDANKEVEPYEEDCGCGEWKLRKFVNEKLEEKFGNFDKTFRTSWNEMPENVRPNWQNFIKPYLDLQKELMEKNKTLGETPDPECDECNGTGKCESTYNPLSQWDWYQLGGRWTGFFLPKKGANGDLGVSGAFGNQPQEGMVDSIRKGDVDFAGTMEMMRKERAEFYAKAMEEVSKKETSKKHFEMLYRIEVSDQGEIESLESYVSRVRFPATFAILKDGEWYERGKMGWWGMVSDEKDEDKWDEQWQKLVESLPDDTLLSVYDCHI